MTRVRRRSRLALLALVMVVAGWPSSAVAATTYPVEPARIYQHAHAHNDYLNSESLTGALRQGFTSIEADVWLDGGSLDLCHDMLALTNSGCAGGGLDADAIGAAHDPAKNHYLVRIYGEPDCPHRWQHPDPATLHQDNRWRIDAWQLVHSLRDETGAPDAVDHISSDHLVHLPDWLSSTGWIN